DLLLQARMCLKRAVWCQRAALKADPNNVQYPRLLNEHYHDLVLVQLHLGDHGGAVEAAGELPPLYPERAEQYVQVAEFLARAIPLVQSDVRLPSAERRDRVEKYAREAIRMLQAAIARGFSKLEKLRTAPVYQPLRSRPDFQRLIEEMDKNKVRNA